MSAPALLLLATAGGLGAAVRFVVDGLLRARFGSRSPGATVVVNLTGSFALGVLTGLVTRGDLAPGWGAVLGAGFLGGYTTFSTASVETVRLLQQRRSTAALLNAFGVLVIAVALAALGVALGRAA